MRRPPPHPVLEPPTAADIEDMARDAFATIPERLARHTDGVVIRVDEFPDEETCREMDLESPFDILGLYRGVSIDHKSVTDPGALPDMIFLYRRPILDYWVETREPLYDIVRHVLIHEIGHHFGFSDAEMHRIEQED
jgi:predicted Zn-dependent protease with MMP-like domain